MKALVLAGGFPQIALINELKSRNVFVILADYYEEPVAKKYADKFYQASTLDINAIEQIAKDEKVDFLITACTDQALLTVAWVSEKLGLPCYIDYETALNVTNKSYMKSVFEKNNISTARHVVLKTLDESAVSHLNYPLIVKPADCNSSKGVKKVLNFKELEVAYNVAVGYSRTNTAIIEEFIEGIEISVDIYVESGKANILAVSESEKVADKDKFVIFRGGYPVFGAEKVMQQIEKTAQQIVDAFGLKDCPMLMQVISDGKKIYVLEFSARTGGSVKYILIKKASGFNVIKAVVDLTMGIKPHYEKKEPEAKHLSNEFIYCNPGIFDHLEGFEELKQTGILDDYYLFKWQGAQMGKVENSGDRIAGFTICGNTDEELREKHNLVVSKIKVIDHEGSDIMRHDLLVNLK